MAKVASSKSVIPAKGFEKQVESFKRAYLYFNDLQAQIEADKREFREVAIATARSCTGPVKTVEFLGADGGVVPVTIKDPLAAGNRVNVPKGLEGELADSGVSLADYTDTVSTFVLSGDFVPFIRQLIAENYTSKGQPVPDGIEEKSATKLTEDGAKKLLAMLKSENEAEIKTAEKILDACISSPSVSVR